MVAGIDVLALRPDDELKRLATRAVELGVAAQVQTASGEQELRAALAGTAAGDSWLRAYENTKDPWFYFSFGNGLYHHHRSWIDDPTLPITMIGSYTQRLQDGEDIRRPQEAVVAERDRVTREHRALLPKQTREAFDQQLLARAHRCSRTSKTTTSMSTTAPTRCSGTRRASSARCSQRTRSWPIPKTCSSCDHDEVRVALEELRLTWSSGGAGVPRGPAFWPPIIAAPQSDLRGTAPMGAAPALGQAPKAVTEPMTIMHWGITTERVQGWLRTTSATPGGHARRHRRALRAWRRASHG